MEASPFAVLLARAEPRDPMALAKALSVARRTPLQDQMMTAKNSWGIVAGTVEEKKAIELVQALQSSGIECRAVPVSSLVTPAKAEAVSTVIPLMNAKPVLIAAAAITVTSTTTKSVKEGPSAAQKVLSTAILLGTGLPIKIGGQTKTVEKIQHHSDLQFVLDVVYESPSRRLRVAAERFDYAFLKERKTYQVLGNFKLLIADLANSFPEAWKNHGTNVLLDGKPIQTMGYASLVDLEREIQWLLTLQRHIK